MLYTPPQPREPVFNVPAVVLVLVVLMGLIHVLRGFASDEQDMAILATFAFIPARYGVLPPDFAFLGTTGPKLWSPVTYAMLHGDWTHFGFNAIWLIIFGTPVARRFGASRLLAFMLVLAAAGAFAHWLVEKQQLVPMIGASAIVSGLFAAAMRFIFEMDGPLTAFSSHGGQNYAVPAVRLIDVVRSAKLMSIIAVWLVLNVVTGLASVFVGDGMTVAWQAHIGGFIAGLLLFDIFDPL